MNVDTLRLVVLDDVGKQDEKVMKSKPVGSAPVVSASILAARSLPYLSSFPDLL